MSVDTKNLKTALARIEQAITESRARGLARNVELLESRREQIVARIREANEQELDHLAHRISAAKRVKGHATAAGNGDAAGRCRRALGGLYRQMFAAASADDDEGHHDHDPDEPYFNPTEPMATNRAKAVTSTPEPTARSTAPAAVRAITLPAALSMNPLAPLFGGPAVFAM